MPCLHERVRIQSNTIRQQSKINTNRNRGGRNIMAGGAGGRSATSRTSDGISTILAGEFWQPGITVTGTYVRSFIARMENGDSKEVFQFLCKDPEVLEIPVNQSG